MAFDYGGAHGVDQAFTLDVAPIQKAFITLASKVDAVAKENAALRSELAELKVAKRLDALEQGLQELADTSRPSGGFFWGSSGGQAGGGEGGEDGSGMGLHDGDAGPRGADGAAGEAGARGRGGMVDINWLISEVVSQKERLAAMERKAEALWHVQENDEQLRGAVDRLRADIQSMQAGVSEAQAAASAASSLAEKQAVSAGEGLVAVRELTERLHTMELGNIKSSDERRELTNKVEATTAQIWDQLRHVEGSLAQRLTLAETSHVAALQEVDEAKEATSEVLQRVDDVKRHTSALEGKLESFNTQVAAAMNPLHNALAAATERLEALAASKQDAASAIRMNDVEVAVARAIEHADRRGDNLLKAIAGVEARLEQLASTTPNKAEVVLTSDLEALLTEHAHELDAHLDRLKGELLTAVASKADREELAAAELRLGSRVDGLEVAILKGLKAISDKVSAALAEKLDLNRFNEFKMQVRAILADVEDRLRDWSPMALGTKAQLGTDPATAGTSGAPTCLLCDSRVRTVRDLRAMGFKEDDKVFTPDRVPMTDPLLPSIQGNRAATIGAHLNARLTGRQAAASAQLRSNTSTLMESLPAASGAVRSGGEAGLRDPGSPTHGSVGGLLGGASGPGALAAALDAGSFASLPAQQTAADRMAQVGGAAKTASARGIKVKVETISGGIMKGQLPLKGNSALAGSGATAARGPRSPVAAASSASGLSGMAVGPSPLAQSSGGERGPSAGSLGLTGLIVGVPGAQAAGEEGGTAVAPWHSESPLSPSLETGPVVQDAVAA